MPSAPLLYLLKAHAVLLLFAAAYFGLLRPLTFFGLNRAFLAFALLFAAAYPALPVPALWPAAPVPAAAWALAGLPAGAPAGGPGPPAVDWPAVLLAGYAAGAGLLLARLLGQLLSLGQLRRTTRAAAGPGGAAYRVLGAPGGPFSFGRTIYLHPAQHPLPAELAAVLAHEQAHVRQAHTLDVLLAHVATALFWANPAAWLLRRALLDNLEYLADAATLRTGLDRRAYQYSLLRLGPAAGSPALVSPFSFSTLKNRVLMMNQPASTRLQLLRYALAGPLVVAVALGFSGAQAQTVTPTVVAATPEKPLPTDVIYYVDGKQAAPDALSAMNPENIGFINLLKGKEAQALTGKTTGAGVVLVTTKGNENLPNVLAFNKKYNAVQPATPAQVAATAAARAYIEKTYPSAKFQSLYSDKKKAGRYVARFEEGGQTKELHFDAQGHPVAE